MMPLILQRMQRVIFVTWSPRRPCSSTRHLSASARSEQKKQKSLLYLHVGPSGDVWTGDSIFAAKHNTPGYVRSIPLFCKNSNDDNNCNGDDNENINKTKTDIILEAMHRQPERLVEVLEDNLEWSLEIYDMQKFSDHLLEKLSPHFSLETQNDEDNENNDARG